MSTLESLELEIFRTYKKHGGTISVVFSPEGLAKAKISKGAGVKFTSHDGVNTVHGCCYTLGSQSEDYRVIST